MVTLTDEQEAVVQHNSGPALVYAVAGAGKTTAMVHRIERLVREKVFSADSILATAFGKGNERDLRTALEKWPHCRAVRVTTLHALGFEMIRTAHSEGLWRGSLNSAEHLDQKLLNLALHEARQRNVSYKRELEGLDRQDFLDYVGRCKNRLHYADLAQAKLPANTPLAQQAEAPSTTLSWYLSLYQLYETVRLRMGGITFDDMLMTAWELLIRHPDLLTQFQTKFHCVIVDEYQDINLAQSDLLHRLTAPHRNYMAVGDDDQTIYQWRGADPNFILEFVERYQARAYMMSDNFRCPAGPLILANYVIRHNLLRQPKRLQLTQGFRGGAFLHESPNIEEMAQGIVTRIEKERARWSLDQMVVLVRLNAQTPPIEQKLISADLPYRVSNPFYDRPEIIVLIDYARIAWLEQKLRQRQPLNEAQKESWREAWNRIANRPKRYLTRALQNAIADEVLGLGKPLTQVLAAYAQRTEYKEYLTDKLEEFADLLLWLTRQFDQPAHDTLRELDWQLGYQSFLLQSLITGDGLAASVQAFVEYARDKGDLLSFLQHIRQLAELRKGGMLIHHDKPAVTLTTIHQAKGLEWPVVLVPHCNDGFFPFNNKGFVAQAEQKLLLEEERRLFYVALTRTKEVLHLYTLKDRPISPFIIESHYSTTMRQLATLVSHLHSSDPAAKQTRLRLAKQLGLERYFSHYYQKQTA